MCKRKSPSSELTSAEVSESSSGGCPEFSWSSFSSSSVSKMPNEGTRVEENVPETRAMDLVGCPRCFMYVMLSEVDPKCPKCKTTVFLEFFKDENFKPDN